MSITGAFLWCICFAILPTIVGRESFPEGGFSWSLVGFVIVKSVIGACFACLSSLQGALYIDALGVANIGTLISFGWDVAGFGGALGPMMAFTLTMVRYYGGMDFPQAFSLFFYIAAGIAFIIALLYIFLHHASKKN